MITPLVLMMLLALPSWAARFPDCLHIDPSLTKAQPDLDALRDCQDKARQKLIDAAQAKGKPLSGAALDKLDDHQRAEARTFMASQPTIEPKEASTPDKEPSSSPENGKLGGVSSKDISRIPAKKGAAVSSLQKRLHAAAGDGSRGITPEMGQDILDSLKKEQGSVSPEMQTLIEAVVKDGGKLTPETMKKLQNAARAAKSQGLDLNNDPKIEKEILEHDFDADKEQKPAPPGVL